MRPISCLLSLAAALALSTAPVNAEDGARQEHRHGGDGKHKAKLLERFDADKDGKLSDSERAAAKAAHDQKKAERKAKIDTDGNGEISDAEKEAARAACLAKLKEHHPEIYAKIDTDSDGVISKEEGKAAREARKERRGKHHGGKPGGDGQTSDKE